MLKNDKLHKGWRIAAESPVKPFCAAGFVPYLKRIAAITVD